MQRSPNPLDSVPNQHSRHVGTKTIQGASLMVLRTLVLYPVGFVGEVLLARLLSPQDFGVYAVASFVTVTLSGVLEVGLAASLIQRPEEPLDEEYQVLFTFQFLTITAFVLLTFLGSPLILPLLNLQVAARWTLLALLLCPWISSLGTMSCVKLERELRYALFAKMDVFRGFTYVGAAVTVAFLGAGVWSFVIAIILSTLVKTWVAFSAAPWPVGFRLRAAGLKETLRFGAMFQLSSLTSLFRDHIGVVLGGPLFGVQSVGYLNWAKNTTYYTSQIFTQVVSRVAFPSISRVQDDRESVREMTQVMLKYVNLFTFPVICIFAALIPEFVSVMYTNKWVPAIPAFYWYSVRMVGSNVTTLFISVLNAVGKIRVSLRILVCWTVLDWTLAVVFSPILGFSGIAAAYGVSVIPVCLWLMIEMNGVVKLDFWGGIFRPLLFSIGAGLFVALVKPLFPASWLSIVVLAASGFAMFAAPLAIWEGSALVAEGKVFLGSVLKSRDHPESC